MSYLRDCIWILGIFMMLFSIFWIITTENVIDKQYERCYLCDGEPCDCKTITESHPPEGTWLVWVVSYFGGMLLVWFGFRDEKASEKKLKTNYKKIKVKSFKWWR